MADRDPPSLAALLDDQRRRWQAGERVEVETYVGQHALTEADAILDLIANEIALRDRFGPPPAEAEYARRFPALAAAVSRLFALRATMGQTTINEPPAADPAPRRPRRPPPAEAPRIPGYEVLEYLDGGGQGEVWKARHLLLGRVVALKVLHDRAELDANQLARFVRESRLAARLDHPNVVRVYDCAEVGGRFHFSMEYAPHGSLKDRLVATGRPPPAVAATLLAALARAVHHLHGLGIVHRDLKPSNVLFGADGAAKVADFGLAKCLNEDTLDLTPTHAVLGTATYMAPEQAAGRNRDVGPATDVYALGAILYECLTGRPPFVGETWLETIHLVQFRPVSPPALECAGLPAALERVCLKCLEKAPDDRYPSAEALAEDLQRFLDGRPVEAVPAEGEDGADTVQIPPPADRAGFPQVPGYVVLELLGRGAMGAVYKARQLSLRRVVALKTVPGNNVSADRWRRLRGEARLVATLNHANIAQIYDMGEHAGLVYIAMEYVPGSDLNETLRRVGPPTPRQAAELVEAVARAAALVHRRGLVHRDLKPANVLLAPPDPSIRAVGEPTAEQRYGTPKVTDFGLARKFGPGDDEAPGASDVDPGESQVLTHAGEIVGTPRYMPPENVLQQARGSRVLPTWDVWSLGVVFYELLTGVPPFAGASLFDLLVSLTKEDPVPPRKLRRDVPRDLEAICLRCLEKDPQRRYANGTELAEALRLFLADPAGGGLWRRLRFWDQA